MKALLPELDRIKFILELTSDKKSKLEERQYRLIEKRQNLAQQNLHLKTRMEQIKAIRQNTSREENDEPNLA